MDFINKAARQDYELEQKLMAIINEGGGGVELPISITDVEGLNAELESKADTEHTHDISDITGLQSALDAKGTSNLTIGTTASTAKAGNWNPPAATVAVAGIVKKMANITDLTEAPTMEDFNNLLTALRTAGLM